MGDSQGMVGATGYAYRTYQPGSREWHFYRERITGCTLEVAHRPARCVHYTCDALKRELHARGRLDAIEPMLDALAAARARFAAAHKARTDRDVLAPLQALASS